MLLCQYVMRDKLLFFISCFVLVFFLMFANSSSFGMYVLWSFFLFLLLLLLYFVVPKMLHNVLHYNSIFDSYSFLFCFVFLSFVFRLLSFFPLIQKLQNGTHSLFPLFLSSPRLSLSLYKSYTFLVSKSIQSTFQMPR